MDDRFWVSDADRDRAAALLRVHFAAGRLTAEELDERLTATLRAKTFGDLRRVLADLPDPGSASFRSPQTAPLVRGYRRLLACYPAWYRRIHEDEMLAVLMADAPQEKQRPGLAEAADLVLGALRIRCQPSRTGEAEPAWRDALAVLSVIVPLLVLLTSVAQLIQALLAFPAPGPFAYGFPLWVLHGMAVPFGLAALVPLALRMRRVAAFAAAGLLIWLMSGLPSQGVALAMFDAYLFLAVGVEILALTASPGPRRGLQILTWKHGAFVVIVTLLLGAGVIPMTQPLRLVVIAVICAGMALASSRGRWLLLLLAIPAYPFLAGFSPPGFGIALAFLPTSAAVVAPFYLPSLALVVLAIAAVRRVSFRSF
jgi:Domain of unknown function (DUF1707)